jgi:hypothetical protein
MSSFLEVPYQGQKTKKDQACQADVRGATPEDSAGACRNDERSTMTAEKFLDRHSQILILTIFGGGVVLGIAVLLLMLKRFGSDPPALYWEFVTPLGIFLVAMMLARFIEKRFISAHPKMQHVWDWMRAGQELVDYPTEEEDTAEIEARMYRKLIAHARAADTAMQLRERIKTNSCPDGIEYRRTLNELIARAERLNRRYLTFWDLVVKKMCIISPHTDPRDFRESHTEKMYT